MLSCTSAVHAMQQSILLYCASLLLAVSADTACRVQQRTSSGLIMPVSGGKGMADALIGEVLAVGEDVKLEVAKGDVVIFSKYVLCTALRYRHLCLFMSRSGCTDLRTEVSARPKRSELVDHAQFICCFCQVLVVRCILARRRGLLCGGEEHHGEA